MDIEAIKAKYFVDASQRGRGSSVPMKIEQIRIYGKVSGGAFGKKIVFPISYTYTPSPKVGFPKSKLPTKASAKELLLAIAKKTAEARYNNPARAWGLLYNPSTTSNEYWVYKSGEPQPRALLKYHQHTVENARALQAELAKNVKLLEVHCLLDSEGAVWGRNVDSGNRTQYGREQITLF